MPHPRQDTDKNARGRVLVIGGCQKVPGGIQLTAEAALRAGAGKVQIGTIAGAALAIGVAMPEVGIIPLAETEGGEIADAGPARADLSHFDVAIIGPAIVDAHAAGSIVDQFVKAAGTRATLVLDAAALIACAGRERLLHAYPRPLILTPHLGEMAAMLACEAGHVGADPAGSVRRAAETFGAVVALKGATTLVAAPDGSLHVFAGGGVGLATGGSGDVLAGIVAGLAARGADPLTATLWGVWLHGEAGRRCAEQIGPLGFLARELLAHVPALMRGV
nr:NAD(P)H-hydrate dehydratase [Novosphingobium sp. SG707]